MLLEIFRMTKLAVVDRQYRAKTRLTQTLETPRLHVWTAASGEQVWNEPEYVVHVGELNRTTATQARSWRPRSHPGGCLPIPRTQCGVRVTRETSKCPPRLRSQAQHTKT